MPTDTPFQPPRKKPSIYWWLGGLFLVLMLLFLLQLFGPSPQIIVSQQTTYITTPLQPNGLPDYEAYLLERSRDGVTPENNAAAILWPALWPGELRPSDYAAITTELGLHAIPSKSAALVPIYKQIAASLPKSSANLDGAEKLLDQVISRPWTSAQYPSLGKWAADNKQPLDALIAGSHRSRCYFPSPSFLNNEPEVLVMMLLPGAQGVREAGRSLSARAMWHTGEHRVDKAWRDLLASHRIGRLATQGPTLIEQFVGMAISNLTCASTVAMLHAGKPSADTARQVMNDLATLPRFSGIAASMDMERVMYLDTVIALSRGDIVGDSLSLIGEDKQIAYARHLCIDWNVALSKGNEFYDRFVAAAQMKDHAARQQALDQIETDLTQLDRNWSANSLFAAAINPSTRSNAVASRFIAQFLPFVRTTFDAEDRANTTFDLTRIAAALAMYRAEHGAYPAKLEDLVPTVLDKTPTDLYHSKPFLYKLIDDGYLLYSAGDNGQDDGSSNKRLNIFEGRPLDELDNSESETARTKTPPNADDISIRVPRPPLKFSVTTPTP